MKIVMKLLAASSIAASLAIPAAATVTVNSPVNDAQVTSPFNLSAVASTCASAAVTGIGFTLDSNPNATIVNGTEIEASVAAAAGAHVLHVQAWVADGSTCDTDVAITVLPAGLIPEVPTSAVSVSSIQSLGGWKGQHDTGGHGSSRGTMTMVNSPSMSGTARKFVTKYAHDGDERYSVTFGDDPNSTNFLYDAWVYFDKSSDLIGNLELDVNQVMPNGENAIFAFQCAGDSQTWDYTMNAGTPKHSRVKWLQSNQYCNPRTWSIDTWHHVQISYSRDDVGNVTYQSVWLDGLEQPINKTVPSAFALGWAVGKVQTQFQVDGIGKSGTTTVYVDNLTVYRW